MVNSSKTKGTVMRNALTPSQKLALLMIRRMDHESVAWKVSEAMRAMGIPWREELPFLVAEGLAQERNIDGRIEHVILPRGVAHAQIIAHDLARAYGIDTARRQGGALRSSPADAAFRDAAAPVPRGAACQPQAAPHLLSEAGHA